MNSRSIHSLSMIFLLLLAIGYPTVLCLSEDHHRIEGVHAGQAADKHCLSAGCNETELSNTDGEEAHLHCTDSIMTPAGNYSDPSKQTIALTALQIPHSYLPSDSQAEAGAVTGDYSPKIPRHFSISMVLLL